MNIVYEAPAGLSDVTELGDPDDRDVLRTGLGEHRRGISHDEVARVGAALVDHHFVIGLSGLDPRSDRTG